MNLPYKKILITGGAGFVGSSLAIKLKEHYPKTKVIALDNLKRRGSELILQRIRQHGIEFIHGDVRNKEDFEDISCDLIIECSAEVSCIAGLNKGLEYLINTNLMGAINCLDLALSLKADFLFLSTSRVYPFDRINKLVFKETDTRFKLADNNILGVSSKGIREDFSLEGVRTFYGACKLAVEHLIKEYIYFRGVRAIVNRCGIITGPWQMGKIDQGIVVFWLASHIFGRPLRYFGWGGKQVRDFIHIDDLFNLVKLQLTDFEKYNGEVFNVGGGQRFSFSLLELTNLCQKITGKKLSLSEETSLREGDVCWYISDISKVCASYDWVPQKSLDKTLVEITKWIEKNKNILNGIL